MELVKMRNEASLEEREVKGSEEEMVDWSEGKLKLMVCFPRATASVFFRPQPAA